MANEKRHTQIPPLDRGVNRPADLDWPIWLALIERKRRSLQRSHIGHAIAIAPKYFVDATCSNFELDGIFVTPPEVTAALSRNPSKRKFRSRPEQRIRNHIAILHSIETSLQKNRPLKTAAVVRWYTSIGSGLCTTELGTNRMDRLDQIVRRINSPQLRLQAAIQEIARMHLELLNDPLFLSFNGIMARLLLRFHLGRCGLPQAIMTNAQDSHAEPATILRLLNAIDAAYDMLRG